MQRATLGPAKLAALADDLKRMTDANTVEIHPDILGLLLPLPTPRPRLVQFG
jgi:hypothetical protein